MTVANEEVASLLEDTARFLNEHDWCKNSLWLLFQGEKVAWCGRGALLEVRKQQIGSYPLDFKDELEREADQALARYVLDHNLIPQARVDELHGPSSAWGEMSPAGVFFNNYVAEDKYDVIDAMMATAKELRDK